MVAALSDDYPSGTADRLMIFLLRHGETHWNRLGRMQGQQDSPLTLRGIEQARQNALRLRETIDDLSGDDLAGDDLAGYGMVTSPLGRAWQTATIVAETLDLDFREIRLEPRLMEVHFGDWEGLTQAEIRDRDPEQWQARMNDRWNHRVPGGESYALVARRAGAWLAEQSPGCRKIVVCHGLTGRVLRGLYGRLAEEETMSLGEAHSCFWRLTDGVVQEFQG